MAAELPYVAALEDELAPLERNTVEWFQAINRHVDAFWGPLRARKTAADEELEAALAVVGVGAAGNQPEHEPGDEEA